MRSFLQLQQEVFTQLKEVKNDEGFWSEQEVKDAINDAYIFIADEAQCFKLEAIIEVVANERKYKLPENYVIGSLHRVEFDEEKIFPISSHELDEYNLNWRDESTSEPTHYLPPGDLCNTDEIILYPKPDTTGAVYNLASESEDKGVITTVEDDSYEEFVQEEGVIVDSDAEETQFDETTGTGPVLDIKDPSGNIKVFGAKYPKRLYNDKEVFLHPITHNPKRVITHGALAVLLSKEGEGKDIAKASFNHKRFLEAIDIFKRPKSKRFHRMRSISELTDNFRGLNLGHHYPSYFMR